MVVGAGLAGLACADALQRAGRTVTVLEARKRPGGRVYTLREPFAAGQHAEGGGEFVDPGDTLMRAYVRRYGLELEDLRTQPDNRLDGVVYLGERRRLAGRVLTPPVRKDIERFWGRVRTLAVPVDPLDPVGGAAVLDRRSAASLLDELHVGGTSRVLLEEQLRDRFNVEPEKLSLLFLCQTFKRAGGRQPSAVGALRIRGGNDQLPDALAREIHDLRLRVWARRIELTAGGVRVHGDSGDVLARFCVLTAPLRAIGPAIEFAPALPSALQDAIQGLQYGVATKVTVQYERRFWRRHGDSGGIVTDLTFQRAWEATSGQAGSRGILTAYVTGSNGAIYAGRHAATRDLLAADEIDDVYPGSRRLYARGGAAVWLNERSTRGSIAAYAPGQVTSYWQVVRRRYGRLLLAGEHTDSLGGTMEGAARSGRRAAMAIEALL